MTADYTLSTIAKMIDHSLLGPVLTDRQLEEGLQVALRYDVASVCIKPYYLARCTEVLAGTTIAPSTVIGFPHGTNATRMKIAEARQALSDGGKELDCVVNIGKVLTGDWDFVTREIQELADCIHAGGARIKMIFENCYLEDAHKIQLCEICGGARVDWVKTSTGYGTGGATLDDLKLMRTHAPAPVQVKAAGGVRTFAQLLEVRALGVTRVGATRTIDILEACRQELGEGEA